MSDTLPQTADALSTDNADTLSTDAADALFNEDDGALSTEEIRSHFPALTREHEDARSHTSTAPAARRFRAA